MIGVGKESVRQRRQVVRQAEKIVREHRSSRKLGKALVCLRQDPQHFREANKLEVK